MIDNLYLLVIFAAVADIQCPHVDVQNAKKSENIIVIATKCRGSIL